MSYERLRNFTIKNSKNLSIIILVIVLMIVSYSINSVITGYTVYSEELEKEVENYKEQYETANQNYEDCKNTVDEYKSEAEQCRDDIKTHEASLQECEKEKEIQAKYSTALQDIVNECESEKSSMQEDYDRLLENYKDVIRDSVTSRCCSYSDIRNDVTKNWDIIDNEIICSGNYTVNCGTGETNY